MLGFTGKIDDSYDGKGTLVVFSKNGNDYPRIFIQTKKKWIVTDEDGLALALIGDEELEVALASYFDDEI